MEHLGRPPSPEGSSPKVIHNPECLPKPPWPTSVPLDFATKKAKCSNANKTRVSSQGAWGTPRTCEVPGPGKTGTNPVSPAAAAHLEASGNPWSMLSVKAAPGSKALRAPHLGGESRPLHEETLACAGGTRVQGAPISRPRVTQVTTCLKAASAVTS